MKNRENRNLVRNSEKGYLSIMVLTMIILTMLIISPINLRTYLVSNLVEDEKQFVFLHYQSEKGLLWALEKANAQSVENWEHKKTTLPADNKTKLILETRKIINNSWLIKSTAMSCDNKYTVEKNAVISYEKDERGLEKLKIKRVE